MKKYTKSDVDYKLDLDTSLSDKEIINQINDLFRHWNNKTYSSDYEVVVEAEEMLEYCAAALEYYKTAPHKRKYKKTVRKKKKSTYKRKTPPLHDSSYDYDYKPYTPSSSTTNDDEGGCLWIFIIIFIFSMCSGI